MKEIYVFVKIFAYITEKEGGKSLEVREASSLNLKMSDIRRFLPLKIVMSQFSDLVVIDLFMFLKMNCA